MTDRHAGYIVVLNHDIREDDAEATINAIKQIKFVAGVEPVISGLDQSIAQTRADNAWREALYKLAADGPDES